MKPLFADLRTLLARRVMMASAGFVALVAPWLALPADRRMSRLLLLAIVVVLALGLGTAGYLAIEAVGFGVGRLQRQEGP